MLEKYCYKYAWFIEYTEWKDRGFRCVFFYSKSYSELKENSSLVCNVYLGLKLNGLKTIWRMNTSEEGLPLAI